MKRIYLAVLAVLAAAPMVLGQQPLSGYTNIGELTTPPVIDATNFVNLGLFEIDSGGSGYPPFDFSDVLTYTNRNIMYGLNGFLFDTSVPTQFPYPAHQPALTFVNQNPGQIYGGASVEITNASGLITEFSSSSSDYPLLNVWASIVTNTGVLDVGSKGLISVTGQNLDLRRGTLNVEGLGQTGARGVVTTSSSSGFLVPGQFDDYWGLGNQNNVLNTNSLGGGLYPETESLITIVGISNNIIYTNTTTTSIFETPQHRLTDSAGANLTESFEVEDALVAVYTNIVNASNTFTQVIIAGDPLGEVSLTAGFDTNARGSGGAIAVVQWTALSVGSTGAVVTNQFYLEDSIAVLTNVSLFTNSTSVGGAYLLMPTNYEFIKGAFGALYTNAPYTFDLFTNAFGKNQFTGAQTENNLYTALDTEFEPVTAVPDPNTAGSTYSNVPGRIEITATGTLDMSNATVNAGNFFSLKGSNFVGNPTASILFPRAALTWPTPMGA